MAEQSPTDELGFSTRAIRVGHTRSAEAEHAEPIFPTSSFAYENAAQAAARFGGDEPGNVYSRFTNPTVQTFEARLAALEGGARCVAVSSGMGAYATMCLSLLRTGDHVVAARGLFGSTTNWLTKYLPRYGIAVDLVTLSDLDEWRSAIRDNTKLLVVESPTNPLMEMVDIPALASIARERGCLLAVDNCFCTPVLQKPLALGADLVLHSATKYLDGQGRCIGGAIVGNDDEVMEEVFGFLRTAGPSLSPFNAWVFTKGLETLPIRMRAHCENALQMAQWLETIPGVCKVHYPGLTSHPQHELAKKQQSGFGGVVSFEVTGGRDAAWHVIDSVQMMSVTGNLGDVKTTITHPASTTHARLTQQQRDEAGIVEGLIRLSVGLEEVADLQADLSRGLLSLPN